MVTTKLDAVLLSFIAASVIAACSSDLEEAGTRTTASAFAAQPGPFPREGECNVDDPFFDGVRHLIGADRNIGPGTLKGTPIPEPPNLGELVRDKRAAIVLGKALFWDMQVGSDGIQACASCHFRAGADPRSKNQVSPGGPDNPNKSFDFPPNTQLTRAMFPLHAVSDPTDRHSTILRSSDDVVSSQGVSASRFERADRGESADERKRERDSVFNASGLPTRRVPARNAPTVINAVFNHRQFWDGRAEPIFNGVNPFGARDPNAKVLKATAGGLEWTRLRIQNASLASQAVGPIVNDVEMAAFDRPLHEVGKRLVSAKPLRLQKVHESDSVLGSLADRDRGLSTTYGALIAAAFQEHWWKSDTIVEVDERTGDVSFRPRPARPLRDNELTLMEWNFSLFFGLAIQLYEATLVSDDAKLDRHFDRIGQGLPGLFTQDELEGMAIFERSACKDCHSGPELTGASVRSLATGFENPAENPSFQPPEVIERMVIGSCEIAIYDQGFYNIGVRPTGEDLGLGGLDPFGNPLSVSKLLTMPPASVPSQELLSIPYPSLMALGKVPPIVQGERTAVDGSFKMPTLRNIALTAPYFHNGGALTLRQAVEFYNRGGDFHDQNDAFMALGIGKLNLTESEIDKLVAFLHTLTDERVVKQAAPFDHPELFVAEDGREPIGPIRRLVQLTRVPEVGASGGPIPKGFLE